MSKGDGSQGRDGVEVGASCWWNQPGLGRGWDSWCGGEKGGFEDEGFGLGD